MTYTYTYTARGLNNPDLAATFTIIEDRLQVNLSGLDAQLSEVLSKAGHTSLVKQYLAVQSATVLMKLIEKMSGPVHIKDVSLSLEGNQISLVLWKRIAGLRLAPMVVTISEVDNPEAAELFVKTLAERQAETPSPGTFPGFLDYWVSWVGLMIVVIKLIKKRKSRKSNK